MTSARFTQANQTGRHTATLGYLTILAGAILALGTALFMQHGQGLQPCTLCIIQRYAFVWLGLCALLAIMAPWRPLRLLVTLLALLGAVGGMVAAGRNLWVLAHPDILCGRDPVEIFLNGLPTAHWLPEVFVASGLCSSPIPPLLGLPLPAWSLIGLLVLAGLLILLIRKR